MFIQNMYGWERLENVCWKMRVKIQHSLNVCVRMNTWKDCTHLMQNKYIDKGVQSGSLLLFSVYWQIHKV